LDQRSRAGQKITAGDIGTTFNPEVSQNTMFPLAEAFVMGGEMIMMIVPGPTGGGRAPIRPRIGGGGGCFVADTLVVMVRPATADALAMTDLENDESPEDGIAWTQVGLGGAMVALGLAVAGVYVWRRKRRRLNQQEELTDAVLAHADVDEILGRVWPVPDDDAAQDDAEWQCARNPGPRSVRATGRMSSRSRESKE
jgi:hypothetical protein